MTKITIPASIEEATDRLTGLERLLTATEWEKAAIVAAFVTTSEQGKGGAAKASSSLSPIQFAALGITGLKSKDTVRRYAEAWEKSGKPKPRPGVQVTLPTVDFTEIAGTVQTTQQKLSNSPGGIAGVLADGKVRQKVIDNLDPETRKQIAAEIIEESTWEEIEDISDMSGSVITTQKSNENMKDFIKERAKAKDKVKDSPSEAMALTIHFKDLVAKTNGRPWRVEVLLKWRDYIDEVLGLESAPDIIPTSMIEGR